MIIITSPFDQTQMTIYEFIAVFLLVFSYPIQLFCSTYREYKEEKEWERLHPPDPNLLRDVIADAKTVRQIAILNAREEIRKNISS